MLIHKPEELSWEQAAGIPEVSLSHYLHFACLLFPTLILLRRHEFTHALHRVTLCQALTARNRTTQNLFRNNLICQQTWITATQALYLVADFKPGKSILWHAGASSVSIAGIQLSKADDASQIFVTAGSDEKIDFCVKELGANAGIIHSMFTLCVSRIFFQSIFLGSCDALYREHEGMTEISEAMELVDRADGKSLGFNYHTQNWSQEILSATDGKGIDIIIDFIGASYFQGNLDAAAKDCRIVHLGAMGILPLFPSPSSHHHRPIPILTTHTNQSHQTTRTLLVKPVNESDKQVAPNSPKAQI